MDNSFRVIKTDRETERDRDNLGLATKLVVVFLANRF